MNLSLSMRGQPLLTFGLVMGGWITLRVLTWDANMPPIRPPSKPIIRSEGGQAGVEASQDLMFFVRKDARTLSRRMPLPHVNRASVGSIRPVNGLLPTGVVASRPITAPPPAGEGAASTDSGSKPAAAPFYPTGHEAVGQRHWSADGWVLWRRGGDVSLATGSAPATYGASQTGAVLRYSLAPQNAHRPAAYLRLTAALNGSDEKEAALGLSARPAAGIPVVAAAELRVSDQPAGTKLRPAVFAVTQLPPFELLMGMRGEAYAQAGYVGGDYATGFADGQLRVDRLVAHSGQTGLRIGAGSWGGAQKGAARLDIGPTAAIVTGLGGGTMGGSASLRLEIDWRFRVAGNAAPGSGPAIALSAGF